MKASSIPAHEKSFFDTGKDAHGKKFILKEVAIDMPQDPTGPLKLVECKRESGDKSYYEEDETEKKKIVLHYTAGYLKGDIATLTQPTIEVSVPFVIARDGRIYNLWDSKFWSYHLGKGCVGGNTEMSKSSIGIELSNIGPLIKKGNDLVTTYSNTDVYCSLSETPFYQQLSIPYRDYNYYATFTIAQYNSLITLLRFLTKKYNIPRQFLAASNRYNVFTTNNDALNWNGILSHVNVRPTGKTDISSAFDWNMVEQGVSA